MSDQLMADLENARKFMLAKSQENQQLKRERSYLETLLAAMCDCQQGSLRVSDRALMANSGCHAPIIEIFEDKDNRCTVIRKVVQ